MPFCPNCRSEYVEGITRCPDCNVRLVPHLEPEFADEEDWQIVYTAAQEFEAELVRARLEEEGILARVLSRADHALGLHVGDLAMVHVIVHPDDAEDARRIVAAEHDLRPDDLDEQIDDGGGDDDA